MIRILLVGCVTFFLGYVSWCALSPSSFTIEKQVVLTDTDERVPEVLSSLNSWVLWEPFVKQVSLTSSFEIESDSLISWYSHSNKNTVRLRNKVQNSIEAHYDLNGASFAHIKYHWTPHANGYRVSFHVALSTIPFWQRAFGTVRKKQVEDYLEVQIEGLTSYLEKE